MLGWSSYRPVNFVCKATLPSIQGGGWFDERHKERWDVILDVVESFSYLC
jgi:hypothetical protein